MVDSSRVLTCAHVAFNGIEQLSDLWLAFPGIESLERRRIRVAEVVPPSPGPDVGGFDINDVAVLVLAEPLPEECAIQVRRPAAGTLLGHRWWAFGFPDSAHGSSSSGIVGEELGYDWIRLDTTSKYLVKGGFSGAGVWSEDYNAVVGMVAQAQGNGDARAITFRGIETFLPEQKLELLTGRSAQAARGSAPAARGWSLATDPEAGLHWRPRARGVGHDEERGHRFRGREAALIDITAWLAREVVDRRVFVVTGSPGVGKSAVLGRIVTTADRGEAAALPPEDTAVRAPLGSVDCAVHAKGKTASQVAAEICRAVSAPPPARGAALEHVLRTALTESGRPGFTLVIDALDEASTTQEARRIARQIVRPLAEGLTDPRVRVLVGTRRTDTAGGLLGELGAAEVMDLDEVRHSSPADLTAYALAALQLRGEERHDNPYNDPAAAGPVAERIAELAGGNFLVAGLLARTHGLHDSAPARPLDVSFSPTVQAALREYLAVLPYVDGIPAGMVLTALALAEDPGLPVDLWRCAVTALSRQVPTEAGLLAFARSSAAAFLIETTDDDPQTPTFQLFHQALNDSLRASRDLRDDELALTRAFVQHGRSGGWRTAPGYLLRSLPGHASRAGAVDMLLEDPVYLLHADLRRLVPATAGTALQETRLRAALLRRTPQALDAGPTERAALFSTTEALGDLGTTYRTLDHPAAYRLRWARWGTHEEATILTGHTRWVQSLCVVVVGGRSLLASAAWDNTVRLWNVETGETERVLIGHSGSVNTVCSVTVEGRTLLASASGDGTVRLWDPVDGTVVRTFPGQSMLGACVSNVVIDGRPLIAVSDQGFTLCFWDPATGSLEHRGAVFGLGRNVVVVEGHTFLVVDDEGTVRLWDVLTGRPERELAGRCHELWAVTAMDIDGRTMLVGTGGHGTVWLWDAATGRLDHALPGHAGGSRAACAVTVDGRTLLATGGSDALVKLWDPVSGTVERVLRGHTDAVRDLCTVEVGGRTLLASCGHDNSVRLWDLDIRGPGEPLRPDVGRLRSVCSIRVGSNTVIALGADSAVHLWDAATGADGPVLTGSEGTVLVCPVRIGGREVLAGGAADGTVRLWDLVGGEQQRTRYSGSGSVRDLCAVPTGNRDFLAAVTGPGDGIHVWDPATGVG
ncbi:hypothetical protein, partial [Kitasatospora sp. NPDC007106]|uniref:nSTAND1 domain-containing NTPase n=1 Tax=Kitasatospora sp. NPDC007106 TaxID=3156914 RepID=UPI0033EF7B78